VSGEWSVVSEYHVSIVTHYLSRLVHPSGV